MELGNIMFNNSNRNQNYECPEFVIALLERIESIIENIYWNENQEEWDSAFRNTGNEYILGDLIIKAYNWNDDCEQQYNFKYKDIEISWYKYLGRDTTINLDLNNNDNKIYILNLFDEIISLLKNEARKNDEE